MAEAIGDFLVGFVDLFSLNGGLILLLVIVILGAGWRLSIALFPEKQCPRCDGKGAWGPGFLRRECGQCKGSGRVPRVGSGR
jgi:hypothetical protein